MLLIFLLDFDFGLPHNRMLNCRITSPTSWELCLKDFSIVTSINDSAAVDEGKHSKPSRRSKLISSNSHTSINIIKLSVVGWHDCIIIIAELKKSKVIPSSSVSTGSKFTCKNILRHWFHPGVKWMLLTLLTSDLLMKKTPKDTRYYCVCTLCPSTCC